MTTQGDSSGVRFPPPLLYALPWLAGWLVGRAYPVHLLPAGWARVLGWLLTALGAVIAASATILFRRAGTSPIPIKPTTALVVTGPYRVTRNPMYVSLAAVYVGVTCLFNTVWPLVLLPLVIVAVQRLVIAKEERYLEAKFGQAYRDYQARVSRWI